MYITLTHGCPFCSFIETGLKSGSAHPNAPITERNVNRQSVQPGAEKAFAPKQVQFTPGPHKRLLQQVLG
jgi:hypothetical protein